MSTQSEEIKAIIEKHMPQQVGDVLRKRLEQADRDATELNACKQIIADRNVAIQSLNNTIEEYKKFDSRNATLEAREKAASDAERKLEIETLKYQLGAEKDKTLFSQSVALGLVRNTEYKKSVMSNGNGFTPGSQHGGSHSDSSNITETTKTE